MLCFNLGFDKKGADTINHWLYFPEKKYCFYRVGFYDNILGQDKMSLYVELGFEKEAIIEPNTWIGKVLRDLKEAGIVSEEHLFPLLSVVSAPSSYAPLSSLLPF